MAGYVKNFTSLFTGVWFKVGHNIYILCHQLAQHNKDLAALLKPSEVNIDPKMNQALDYYASHTAQIEVSPPKSMSTLMIQLFFLQKKNNLRHKFFYVETVPSVVSILGK